MIRPVAITCMLCDLCYCSFGILRKNNVYYIVAVPMCKPRLRQTSFLAMMIAFTLLACALAYTTPTVLADDTFVSRDFTVPIELDTTIRVKTSTNFNADAKANVLLVLHGFCLSDDGQQSVELSSQRLVPAPRNALNIDRRRQQTLVQTGLRHAVMDAGNWLYVYPDAPHVTRSCVLCNLQNDSPNPNDRLVGSYITGTLQRASPELMCRAWDGSDACCNAELSGDGDDVRYIERVLDAVKAQFQVNEDGVYAFGIATGGFMANRLACEKPDMFRGVVSFAGATFKDPGRCKPNGATSVLEIHGTGDLTVPVNGGVNARGIAFPSSDETFDIIGAAMKCASSLDSSTFTLPSEGRRMPPVKVRKSERQSCQDGVRVEQWLLEGVDHFMEKPTSEKLFEKAFDWLKSL